MSQSDAFDSFIKQFFETAPKELQAMSDGLKQHFKASIRQALNRMDLVSREEFDAQTRLLERLNQRCSKLEQKLKHDDVSPSD